MNVLPNDDELSVQRAAGEFLAAQSPPALVRAAERHPQRYSQELWQQVAELGWLGIALPQAQGGQELPLGFLGLLFEELGRHIAPVPMLDVMVASLTLARHGTPSQRDLLPKVIAGDLMLTFAAQEPSGGWSLEAMTMRGHAEGDEFRLSGRKAYVGNFEAAQKCVVVVRIDGEPSLALIDTDAPGIHRTALISTAGDAGFMVDFDAVRVHRTAVFGDRIAAQELLDLAAMFTAALMVGAAGEATRRAAEYAGQRQAFGQPIGAFQAIQHLCADMLIGVDGARLLTREAISLLAGGLPAGVEVAQAKAFANEKCLMACRAAQQIFGGIGFIAEFDQQLWYRRVASWSLRAGTVMEHRARVAAALLDNTRRIRLGDALSS